MIPGIGSGAARCPERVVVSGEGADRVVRLEANATQPGVMRDQP